MAKQKKKRNKTYHGVDAKTIAPRVVKVEAVSRSRTGQWWFEKKKIVKPIVIALLVIFVIIVLLIELIQLIF